MTPASNSGARKRKAERLAHLVDQAIRGFDRAGIPVAVAQAILSSDWLASVREAAKAEAWDEGYVSGHSNAMRRMSDEPNAPATPNPYRRGGAQ